MRGQILLVALLSAAPGESALPSSERALPRVPPAPSLTGALAPARLAPSSYAPEVAPSPVAEPDGASPAATPALGARQRRAAGHVARLAPSPYAIELMLDPYVRLAPAVARTHGSGVAASFKPRVLAPSPYEPQLASILAPSPY